MKVLYRIYEGTDFPVNVISERCVKTSGGDYIGFTGNFYSKDTHSTVRKFYGKVWQIVDPAFLGVNSAYQNNKIPFIDCYMTFEELELYNDTEKIYYCKEIDTNFHDSEFDKITEIFEDAQEL